MSIRKLVAGVGATALVATTFGAIGAPAFAAGAGTVTSDTNLVQTEEVNQKVTTVTTFKVTEDITGPRVRLTPVNTDGGKM